MGSIEPQVLGVEIDRTVHVGDLVADRAGSLGDVSRHDRSVPIFAADVLNEIDLRFERDVVILRDISTVLQLMGRRHPRELLELPDHVRLIGVSVLDGEGGPVRRSQRRRDGVVSAPEPLQAGEALGRHSDLGREQLHQPTMAQADFADHRFDRGLAPGAECAHRKRHLAGEPAVAI